MNKDQDTSNKRPKTQYTLEDYKKLSESKERMEFNSSEIFGNSTGGIKLNLGNNVPPSPVNTENGSHCNSDFKYHSPKEMVSENEDDDDENDAFWEAVNYEYTTNNDESKEYRTKIV